MSGQCKLRINFYLDCWNDILFLRVLKCDFSQWPKTLYLPDVYEINIFII